MPLDEFQKSIIRVIRDNRDKCSVFAGGAVIQQHGFRLSNDRDIFTDSETGPIADMDVKLLRDAGFMVQQVDSFKGFREFRISKPELGTTLLQWTQALSYEYFAPVPDPMFGQRLHFADLAANKVQAASRRLKLRDFIDLWMLDRHVIPLWRMANAASGKFSQKGPVSLLERMSFNLSIVESRARDDHLTLTMEMPEGEPVAGLVDSIREAMLVLPDIAGDHLGKLQLNDVGCPVTCRKPIQSGNWIEPQLGGAMPSFDGMDSEMIADLIREYGPEGSRYTGGKPTDVDRDSGPVP